MLTHFSIQNIVRFFRFFSTDIFSIRNWIERSMCKIFSNYHVLFNIKTIFLQECTTCERDFLYMFELFVSRLRAILPKFAAVQRISFLVENFREKHHSRHASDFIRFASSWIVLHLNSIRRVEAARSRTPLRHVNFRFHGAEVAKFQA